jgi:hypothetical protein
MSGERHEEPQVEEVKLDEEELHPQRRTRLVCQDICAAIALTINTVILIALAGVIIWFLKRESEK